MKSKTHPVTIYRHEYAPPEFFIDEIHLTFRLDAKKTIVTARSSLRKNTDAHSLSLRLDGENLQLKSIKINGEPIGITGYQQLEDFLEIDTVPDSFSLEIVTEINPDDNSALSGLYRTNGNYCTQCEAEGFRRITYFIDRPDILTRFTTRIEAKKED